ncbi:MAG: cell division protein FtsZ, partial [Clostridia bacterium]|nr:cell division protein FtsZ [Clostridia bacterium]
LRQGIQGISYLIAQPGMINLDFADVRTIMKEKGMAHMGIGMASGDKRAVEAAKQAVASPLLETTINGAKGILLNITGGPNLSMSETAEAAGIVQEYADPDANIIMGTSINDDMGDTLRITVIATGFEGPTAEPTKPNQQPKPQVAPVEKEVVKTTLKEPSNTARNDFWNRPRTKTPEYTSPLAESEDVTPHYTKRDLPGMDSAPAELSNLDLPSFLRNRE